MIYEYFHAIKNKWPKSWDDLNTKGNILPRSNAFKAFMKFLHYIFQNITGQVLDRNDFKYFCKRDAATVIVRDVHRLKKIVEQEYPTLPYFIFGHSLGSLITRNYLF